MKAIGKCPKCGETITTDCGGCINGNIYECQEEGEEFHECAKEDGILENVKWKLIPENEKEFIEVEDSQIN